MAVTTPYGFFFWMSVSGFKSHLSRWPLGLVIYLARLRFQRREWWAIMLRNIEIASSQLDNSFAGYGQSRNELSRHQTKHLPWNHVPFPHLAYPSNSISDGNSWCEPNTVWPPLHCWTPFLLSGGVGIVFFYCTWLLIVHTIYIKKVTRQQIYGMPTGSVIVWFGHFIRESSCLWVQI